MQISNIISNFHRYTYEWYFKSFVLLSRSPHVVALWRQNCVHMLLTIFRVTYKIFLQLVKSYVVMRKIMIAAALRAMPKDE